MPNDDGLKKTLQPVSKEGSQDAEFRQTEQNTDGSTSRQDRVYRYTGLDTTPTISVSAENDEIVRVIAHEFPEGAVATLQAVFGHNSGTNYSDVMHEGLPVTLSDQHTILTIPYSGRYRFIFKDGWEQYGDARVSVIRQERIPEWGGASAPLWEPTNDWQCRADGLYEKEINQFGRIRWVRRSANCGWVATGELQCRSGIVWQRERNRAGDFRWVATTDTCYDPTYPLPCGGWAFGPGDVRDPAASLELEDCVDGVGQGIWVYPAPGPGHTFPVYDCMADFYCLTPEDIEGYAANQTITGIRNKCYDGTSTGCNGDDNG